MDNAIKKAVGSLIEDFESTLGFFIEQTESPIEKLFLLKLLCHMDSFSVCYRISRFDFEFNDGYEMEDHKMAVVNFFDWKLLVIPQFKVTNKIRADFLLYLESKDTKIIIECDGHDFHEKTKEQARKDKQRDRFLIQNGFFVLRYTGSEIFQKESESRIFRDLESFLIDRLRK